ncbi:MAG: hypothetical protein LBT81_02190, partial [Helicobacteraceae bacterium]|nr:hypothetical protein [Helicobacteraceae bacterium]
MSNTFVLTEKDKITCPHGGKVVLVSSETMYVIGGDKPVLMGDLAGSAIKGCGLSSKQGGPCKSVASASGTNTEDNVKSLDGTFLLRADNCKTDKGYPLTLAGASQSKWKINAKQSAIVERLEEPEIIEPENAAESESLFYILPMRRGYKTDDNADIIKPLRPKRDFRLVPEYYASGKPSETADGVQGANDPAAGVKAPSIRETKVSTYIDPRLYIVSANPDSGGTAVNEYRVISDAQDIGAPLFSPLFSQITFYGNGIRDKQDKANADSRQNNTNRRRYRAIPCEKGKSYELFYSEMPIPITDDKGRLNESIANRFRSDNINYAKIDSAGEDSDKLQCVRHYSILGGLTQEDLERDRKRKPIERTESVTDDNDYIFDAPDGKDNPNPDRRRIFASARELNALIGKVNADKGKEASANGKDADRRADNQGDNNGADGNGGGTAAERPLTRGVFCIAAVINDPIGEIEDLYNGYEFSYLYRRAVNKPVFDELRDKNAYAYGIASIMDYLYVDKSRQEAYKKKIKNLHSNYTELHNAVANDLGKALVAGIPNQNLAPLIDLPLAKSYMDEIESLKASFFDPPLNNHQSLELRADENTSYEYSVSFQERIKYMPSSRYGAQRKVTIKPLKLEGDQFEKNMPHTEANAMLVFSAAYSARHADLREKHPDFQKLCGEFYALFRSIRQLELPGISETAIGEIRAKLDDQDAYQALFSGDKTSLINEYDSIETAHRQSSFDMKSAGLDFASLSLGKGRTLKSRLFDPKLPLTPRSFADKISKALKEDRLRKILEIYGSFIETLKNDESRLKYADFMSGLLYNLMAPRAFIDEESDPLSPFKEADSPVAASLAVLSLKLYNGGSKELRAQILSLPVRVYLDEALGQLCIHAEYKGGRHKANMESFFDSFKPAQRPKRESPRQRTPFDIYYGDEDAMERYGETLEIVSKIA